MNNYLKHYGILGMKWGVRRYQNKDGTLNQKGIQRYSRKGYASDQYNSNKTVAGKIYDKITNAHNYGGRIERDLSTDAENKNRAYKYQNSISKKKDPRQSK